MGLSLGSEKEKDSLRPEMKSHVLRDGHSHDGKVPGTVRGQNQHRKMWRLGKGRWAFLLRTLPCFNRRRSWRPAEQPDIPVTGASLGGSGSMSLHMNSCKLRGQLSLQPVKLEKCVLFSPCTLQVECVHPMHLQLHN